MTTCCCSDPAGPSDWQIDDDHVELVDAAGTLSAVRGIAVLALGG
jgi:hypothetical protein